MATYYYDKTSPIGTAGFGTLLGGWNDAVWSTSGAGTATSGSTWTALATGPHTASFGGTSNTATANTVTVTGTISNLAGLIFAASPLLSGNQTVTGGTLNFGSTAGSIVVNGNTPTISSIIAGTNGFTKSGSATLQTNTVHQISGALSITAGNINSGNVNTAGTTTNVFPNASSWVINGGNLELYHSNNAAYSVTAPISGNGLILVANSNTATYAANGITFNDLSGFTGLVYLYQNGNANNNRALVGVKKLPTGGGTFLFDAQGVSTSPITTVTLPSDATPGASSASFWVRYLGSNSASNWTTGIYANNTSGAVSFSGDIYRDDGGNNPNSPAITTFTLGGSSSFVNTISGLVRSVTKQLALTKVDAGTWNLSAANTYTGGTTISGGALRASNNSALGTGNITLSSGTLELNGVSLTGATTTAINTLGTISAVSGNNSLSSDITLAGTTTVDVAGDSLTLSGLISGSTALNKTGTGLATLSNTNNNFTSSPSISAGILAVPSIAAAGTNSALGAGSGLTLSSSGVLRYTGSTGATLSRTVTGTSLSGAGFDNTGSASLAVTNATMDGTISLAASNSASQFNILTATISSGGFTKTGDGRWIVTTSNDLAGATTVTTGTLMGANADGATKRLLGGAVTIAAGAKIQLGSDNDQKGRNRYNSLIINGTAGSKSRIRIGGSAVSPTVQMSGNLTISGAVTWKLTADVFKSPGTYRLVEFVSGALVGNINDVTVQVPTGRSVPPGGLVYDGASSPKTITVTVN